MIQLPNQKQFDAIFGTGPSGYRRAIQDWEDDMGKDNTFDEGTPEWLEYEQTWDKLEMGEINV